MAIRTRKEERERIVALLESPFPTATELADAVLKEAYLLLQRREWWVFGADLDGIVLPYGFYATSKEALKAAVDLGGPIAGVNKIRPAWVLAEKLDRMKDNPRPVCETCRHPLDIHLPSGNVVCPVKGCTCTKRY